MEKHVDFELPSVAEPVKPVDADRNDVAPPKKPLDRFDPSVLRLTQDFGSFVGGEKVLTTIAVHKPSKENWIRVHPDKEYRLDVLVLELKEDREVYLLAGELAHLNGTEPTLRGVTLCTCVTRNGNLFLWPIPLPDRDGKDNRWFSSAREAARLGMGQWVRVTSNQPSGAYETTVTKAALPDPIWPKKPFSELLEIAFRDRFIDSVDHPVLKRLRGEA
ncbi:hypothetical protein K2Y11_08345 [bacterium]|nr:hypothetical protein [bacterium]